MDLSGPRALLLGLLIGVLVGSAMSGPLAASTHSPSPDPDDPPTSVSMAGPSCYDGSREAVGWLHVVANGETWAVTMNATVVHPAGTEIDVTVSRRPTGDYEIALDTVGTARDRSPADGECRASTTLDVATALSRPSFLVTVDGRTIRSVEQDETVANLYPLANPVDATG